MTDPVTRKQMDEALERLTGIKAFMANSEVTQHCADLATLCAYIDQQDERLRVAEEANARLREALREIVGVTAGDDTFPANRAHRIALDALTPAALTKQVEATDTPSEGWPEVSMDLCHPPHEIDGVKFTCANEADNVDSFACTGSWHRADIGVLVRCTCPCHTVSATTPVTPDTPSEGSA